MKSLNITEPAELDRTALLERATSDSDSAFDYIIVGSGAGGGPMAARLALEGKRVLLLEAGIDAAKVDPDDPENKDLRAIYQAPGYHAPSSEDPEMAWEFSVRHHEDDVAQARDDKYFPTKDPSQNGGNGKGGILYPRCAAVGGCTAHHAMIVVAPNNSDWDNIAERTGDDTWRAEHMQGYFEKIEDCLYYEAYGRWFEKIIPFLYNKWRDLIYFLSPRNLLDKGGHGFKGWMPTSLITPELLEKIIGTDKNFLGVLFRSIHSVVAAENGKKKSLIRATAKTGLVKPFDYNDKNTRKNSPEGPYLIAIGTTTDASEDVEKDSRWGGARFGSRMGVREHLLETQEAHPDRLVIYTGVHAQRVIFEATDKQGGAPRAVGIEGVLGSHLYEASPMSGKAKQGKSIQFFAKEGGEVILCGGTFNTPQMLMLSGVGDAAQLDEHDIVGPRDKNNEPVTTGGAVVDLPGVGRNLQDRFEVSVISELASDFTTLDGVSFDPEDEEDPALQEWKEKRTGLYATNGGAISILKNSKSVPERKDSDLFIFGFPAAFRGYYWGYSKELLSPEIGNQTVEDRKRNLWSWVILKAYAHNDGGSVRLRNSDPFAQPDILFNSFVRDGDLPNDDLEAVSYAVDFVRKINRENPEQFVREMQPGPDISADPENGEALKQWIEDEAWGHHACGTCRMGSDEWKADTSKLSDHGAVLDSKFRVHGVDGLRVVDASVFPDIPGYFIVTPIFMVSEKAATTLLEDAAEPVACAYPDELREREMTAIRKRREIAGGDRPTDLSPDSEETVGLALSGGGIRSASFCVGVLQAIAGNGKLRDIDIMSSVSGGGYTGSFIGRLFTRPTVTKSATPVTKAEEIVADVRSAPNEWLRSKANYIGADGDVDLRGNLGLFWRNLFTIHMVIGVLLLAVFTLLRGFHESFGSVLPAFLTHDPKVPGTDLILSDWWAVPPAILGLGLAAGSLGYWLAPRPGKVEEYSRWPLLVWLTLLLVGIWAFTLPGVEFVAAAAGLTLVSAWIWQESARWGLPSGVDKKAPGQIVRNRLTRSIGEALYIFFLSVLWVLIDTLSRNIADTGFLPVAAMVIAAAAPFLPVLRWFTEKLSKRAERGGKSNKSSANLKAALIAFPLAAVLLVVVNTFAHRIFLEGTTTGWIVFFVTLLISFLVGRGVDFLNFSSLHATYTARLVRTFQGATNERRIYSTDLLNVQETHPEDDIAFDKYRPEMQGGPLHLINLCVNETVDYASQLKIPSRKGLPMTVGSEGVTVGSRFISIWDRDDDAVLDPVREGVSDEVFHVLARNDDQPVTPEALTLGQWIAISGAAFSTGTGQNTSFPIALLTGLLNIRLGYWWDSSIPESKRPGRYPLDLWERLKLLPQRIARVQAMILGEWHGRFYGPAQKYWYLSDGGHFETTGLYELIRRRTTLMIGVDASADPNYQNGVFAGLARRVREDFGAEITWLDPEDLNPLPDILAPWVKRPQNLTTINQINRAGEGHAAIAEVRYDNEPGRVSYLLYLKASLTGDEPLDVTQYAATHPRFPNQPTSDQFFDDDQWESYRKLGEHVGSSILSES